MYVVYNEKHSWHHSKICICGFFAIFCRSLRHNIPASGLFRNKLLVYSLIGESLLVLLFINYPVLMGIFDFVTLELTDWLLIMILAPISFVYSEVLKIALR
ncbi:MAG: hypothetical protein GQ471_01420 [Nitrosopumilus sp.]|nr:hypothetical protein [Nitrosopumilus sp.]